MLTFCRPFAISNPNYELDGAIFWLKKFKHCQCRLEIQERTVKQSSSIYFFFPLFICFVHCRRSTAVSVSFGVLIFLRISTPSKNSSWESSDQPWSVSLEVNRANTTDEKGDLCVGRKTKISFLCDGSVNCESRPCVRCVHRLGHLWIECGRTAEWGGKVLGRVGVNRQLSCECERLLLSAATATLCGDKALWFSFDWSLLSHTVCSLKMHVSVCGFWLTTNHAKQRVGSNWGCHLRLCTRFTLVASVWVTESLWLRVTLRYVGNSINFTQEAIRSYITVEHSNGVLISQSKQAWRSIKKTHMSSPFRPLWRIENDVIKKIKHLLIHHTCSQFWMHSNISMRQLSVSKNITFIKCIFHRLSSSFSFRWNSFEQI